jgi:uncharacterized protein YjbI with pentapeptide repeats
VNKYIIAVIFLLSLMQGKSEAHGLECANISDDKKRLACFDGLSSNTKKVDKVSNNQVEMNIKRLKKMGSCNKCDLTGANLSGFSIGSVVQLRRAILNGADMSNGYFSYGRFYGAQLMRVLN